MRSLARARLSPTLHERSSGNSIAGLVRSFAKVNCKFQIRNPKAEGRKKSEIRNPELGGWDQIRRTIEPRITQITRINPGVSGVVKSKPFCAGFWKVEAQFKKVDSDFEL